MGTHCSFTCLCYLCHTHLHLYIILFDSFASGDTTLKTFWSLSHFSIFFCLTQLPGLYCVTGLRLAGTVVVPSFDTRLSWEVFAKFSLTCTSITPYTVVLPLRICSTTSHAPTEHGQWCHSHSFPSWIVLLIQTFWHFSNIFQTFFRHFDIFQIILRMMSGRQTVMMQLVFVFLDRAVWGCMGVRSITHECGSCHLTYPYLGAFCISS